MTKKEQLLSHHYCIEQARKYRAFHLRNSAIIWLDLAKKPRRDLFKKEFGGRNGN